MKVGNRPRGRRHRDATELSHARTLLRLIEDDRHRLARELHDETGQILTAALYKVDLHLSGLRTEDTRAVAETVDIRLALVDALRDLRHVVYRLHPPMLAENGLVPAVRWLVQQFSTQYRIAATIEAPDDCRLPATMDLAVFRIVQEALTNVAKHSQAKNVTVRLTLSRDWVTVYVQDDGQGFDPNPGATTETSSLGVMGMRERTREFGGDVVIFSVRGEGTTVRARFSRRGIAHAGDSGTTGRRSRHSSSGFARHTHARDRHRNRRRGGERARWTSAGSTITA